MTTSFETRVSTAYSFLETILPPEGNGWYCAVVIHNKRTHHYPCDTIEKLARKIIDLDDQGYEVYHACSTFKPQSNPNRGFRKADNVQAIRSLWCEFDCGPESERFKDAGAAYRLVIEEFEKLNIPRPVFVGSGYGLHGYLVFDEIVDHATWKELSTYFKSIMVKPELHERIKGKVYGCDAVVITDAARILRTPGTHNRKHGGFRDVTWDRSTQHVVRTMLMALFRHLNPNHTPGTARITRATAQRCGASTRSGVIDSILHESTSKYEASWFRDIANHCNQIAEFRRSGNRSGWHLCIGVAAFCQDGEQVAHEYSKNDYPKYNYTEVQNTLTRKGEMAGPTTCAAFKQYHSDICQGCKYDGNIHSPIQLGEAEYNKKEDNNKEDNKKEDNNKVDLSDIELPGGYGFRNYELVKLGEDNAGVEKNIKLVGFPFHLAGIERGEINGKETSWTFRHHLPHEGGWRIITLPSRELIGPGGIAEMISRGAVVHDETWFRKYCKDAADEFSRKQTMNSLYEQFGWKGDLFLYGTRLYGPGVSGGPGVPVEVAVSADLQTRAENLKPIGELPIWKRAAEMEFQAGLEAHASVVLCGAGAIFMPWQDASEGGTVVHAWGNPGGGKTQAARVVWTMWCERERWLQIKDRDTRISRPRAMAMIGNLPIIHDEFDAGDPEIARRGIMEFTDGEDRLRATKTGGLVEQKGDWHTILVSNSNRSLGEYVDDGSDRGAAARLRTLCFRFEMPPGTKLMAGEEMKNALEKNSGHAGDMMLRFLVNPENLAWSKAYLKQVTAEISAALGDKTELRFRVRAIGCAALAGHILNQFKIIEHDTKRIIEWMVNNAADERPQESEFDKARDIISRFIFDKNGETVIVVTDRPVGHFIPAKRAPLHTISMRYAETERRLWIADAAIREWCRLKKHSYNETMRVLIDNRVIVPRKTIKNMTFGTDLPGAQLATIEVDLSHPAMSGMLVVVPNEKMGVS